MGGGGEWGTTDPCNVVVVVDVSTQWLFKNTSFFWSCPEPTCIHGMCVLNLSVACNSAFKPALF